MTDVEQIRIESDERGFELHLVVGDDIEVDEQGRVILNIQQVIFDLYGEVSNKVLPYVAEAQAARREYDSGIADDPSQQDVLDRMKRTFTDFEDKRLEAADLANKARKENR